MRIMVTGSGGMLGQDLMDMLSPTHDVLGCDLHNCNILVNAQVEHTVSSYRPDVIIHAAAYTNVDQAESEQDAARKLNETGTRNIAAAAKTYQSKLIYLSTDYVFDGAKTHPYIENDPTCPVGVYGKTKLLGEQQVQQIGSPAWLIVRTAWLYGARGKSFAGTILQRARQEEMLYVVDDQIGSPTYTKDLVRGIVALFERNASGIVHLTNSGSCSWYEFAKTIVEIAGFSSVTVQPISTEELQRPAPRPAFSVLDTSKFTVLTGQTPRHWKQGLEEYLQELTSMRDA